jgi:hypothetical protein
MDRISLVRGLRPAVTLVMLPQRVKRDERLSQAYLPQKIIVADRVPWSSKAGRVGDMTHKDSTYTASAWAPSLLHQSSTRRRLFQ